MTYLKVNIRFIKGVVTDDNQKFDMLSLLLYHQRIVVVWCGSQNELNKQKINEVASIRAAFFMRKEKSDNISSN
jgi:hypothetical protein